MVFGRIDIVHFPTFYVQNHVAEVLVPELCTLGPSAAYLHHETFKFHDAIFLGLRFRMSRGWVGTPEGCKQHDHIWSWML